MRRTAAFILASALVAGWTAPPAEAAKDELVIGITQFPSTFHPNIDAMMAKSYVLAMTRRPFTVYDKDWRLVCMLCTKLPTIDNGLAVPERTPDGKQGVAVTYTIRPDARWGDGRPVTSADVVFTWRVGRHPMTGVGDMEFYRSLYSIDVKDDRTFTMHFDKLTFSYNDISGLGIIPKHLDELPFSKPAEYKNRTLFDTDTTNEGLYFGPYLIDAVAPGSHVVLAPNPTWWGAKPRFKRIVVRVVENTAALEANLLSGAIDMIAGELGLTIDQAIAFEKRQRQEFTFLERLRLYLYRLTDWLGLTVEKALAFEEGHGGRFDVLYKAGLIYEHIDLNLDNPILKDKRLRKALIHAIDREAISRQLFAGRQPVAHSSVNPLDWVYDEDLPKYAYDPKEAARLLSEAGWSKTQGGFRHNAKGERLTLEIMTTAGNRSRELVEQVLQNQWKRAGIDLRIRNEPARVFFGQTVTERRFTGLAMFAWISAPESVPRTTLHSAHIPKPENNFSGQNYTGFVNAEMDDLVERIEVELDREKRRRLWSRLQRIYADELPVIPLYFRANPFVLPKWLKGVEPTGHQYPTTLWVENWRAE